MPDTEMMSEEFRALLESHPERIEAALDALTALTPAAEASLPPDQLAAYTDVLNLLARCLGRG